VDEGPVPSDPDPSPEAPIEPELPPAADWAETTLRRLTLEQKVGQMLMPFVLGDFSPNGSSGWERITEMVDSQQIGGVITSVGTPVDVAVKLNALQRRSTLPLLVAADLETGAGFRMQGAVHLPTTIPLGGATMFPSMMAIGATGDPELAYQVGAITAREARAVGIHVPFAPVLDVNNNPDNPVINVRAFGEDPDAVSSMGAMLVRGIQDNGGIATGKHFPGHGDTDVDSHMDLPLITVNRLRLDSIELVPFRRAIEEGVGGIMTAHIAVPSITEDNGTPATLSENVLTTLLRGEMGFEGLIFTDAMDMAAIARRHSRQEAAVRAVLAGADVILMPPSASRAIEGVVAAVRNGRITEARIDASVLRILRAKQDLGLDRSPLVDIEAIPRKVGIPSHTELAQEIANRSIALMKNEGDLLPLAGTRSASVLSVTYRRRNDLLAGRYFDGTLRSTYPRLRTATVERDTDPEVYESLLQRARRANLVVVSIHVAGISYQGKMTLPEELSGFIQDLAAARVPHVVVSFGNPYLLREFPDVRAYVLAWSSARVSQRAAARALLGTVPFEGRTPTRIPPFFEIGDGIQIPMRSRAGDR
jgi:beta-N-acetylhexosaminidase